MSPADPNDTELKRPFHARVRSVVPDHLITDPPVPISAYRDGFGNWCNRIVAPRAASDFRRMRSSTIPARPMSSLLRPNSTPVQDLPDETLVFLLGSRYCETDHLSETAW